MQMRRLGRSEILVSQICLGTMTWGVQNTEAEGHAQMDYAVSRGVNFFDAAEMYPTPPSAETYGRTEEIIGSWFAARGGRDRIVLATKAHGPDSGASWVRGGKTRHDEPNLRAAVEASLKRLRTDYIDLYQLHWPNRHVNSFGRLGWTPPETEDFIHPAETLGALGRMVEEGKLRAIGLSNETPWGVMTFLREAEKTGLPRTVSVQNPYNLLNRTYEIGLSEISVREEVSLLAYSPLAGGTLTGKYLGGVIPPGSRRSVDHRGSRYDRPAAEPATAAYVALAQRHGLDPAQMALAYVNTRPFLTANIIGATSMEQLATNMASLEVTLDDEVLAAIEAIHVSQPNPCP